MNKHTSVPLQKAVSSTFMPVRSRLLQRECACGGSPGVDGECTTCRKKRLQRQAIHSAEPTAAPPIVHEVLRTPGQPLDAGTRSLLEPRFGHDFSQVRVHTDGQAAESARSVNALAYTVNQDVVFGPGQYRPHTTLGQRLLAHELTHALQQREASGANTADLTSAEIEAQRVAESVTNPAGTLAGQHIGAYAPALYRQATGATPATAPAAATGMSDTEFERRLQRIYGFTIIRTGTEAEQTDAVASRARQPASAITLPGWQSWPPGGNSEVYDLILESLEDFHNSVGGVPAIREIVFFNTEYDVSVTPAGVTIPQANPDVGASFGSGVLTIYRALTRKNKALPVARSNAQGNYPPVGVAIGGVTGQTPGAPLPYPDPAKSIRRLVTHELGHGLAEAAMSLEPGTFNDYRQAVGWTAANPAQLFDIGEPTVQAALVAGTPPPAQFEITINNWNSPQWVEQPVSDYMVSGGPSEDFAEAVMTFVREPNLLLARSPRRFRFLWDRKERWQRALLQVPQVGDFPLPRGDQRAV